MGNVESDDNSVITREIVCAVTSNVVRRDLADTAGGGCKWTPSSVVEGHAVHISYSGYDVCQAVVLQGDVCVSKWIRLGRCILCNAEQMYTPIFFCSTHSPTFSITDGNAARHCSVAGNLPAVQSWGYHGQERVTSEIFNVKWSKRGTKLADIHRPNRYTGSNTWRHTSDTFGKGRNGVVGAARESGVI